MFELWSRCVPLIGLILLIFFLSAVGKLSLRRKKYVFPWKTVSVGLLLQFFLAAFVLKTALGQYLFEGASAVAQAILQFSSHGAQFLFGALSDYAFLSKHWGTSYGFVFAFNVLPTIIFVSALMSVLYHVGLIQFFVKLMAQVMMKLMGASGAESLSAAANVFAGQTEAPLVVKPYIPRMTKSELLSLMTGGMATVSGGVLAAYIGMGVDPKHLLSASVISAPAALLCAKLLLPEREKPETQGKIKMHPPQESVNLFDAATQGATDGLYLSLNVGAMLLAFISLLALINAALGALGGALGWPGVSLELLMSYVFAPVAYFMGVPMSDSFQVGGLLGKKIILNEFVAYAELIQVKGQLSERAQIISTYALCGFSNFASIGIQMAGLGTMAPGRKKELAKLGLLSMIGGTVACFITAIIASFFI